MANTNHAAQQKPIHVAVAMVPLPAQGHLNQLLHLSGLISAHNIPVYYVGSATHIRQARLRVHGWDQSATANVRFHEFPAATSFDNPPPDPYAASKFPSQLVPSLTASTLLREPVYELVVGLSRVFRRVVVIHDALMSYVVQDVGSLPNVESYSFGSISAFAVCSWEVAHLPDLPPEAEILKEVPSMDGYYPQEFREFLNLQNSARKISSGEIYNTNEVIEGLYLDLLGKAKRNEATKRWAIGPFHLFSSPQDQWDSRSRHRCLEWLDRQEANTVIYVSFGTTTSFSDEQIKEIALGLERSEQRFVWVLRDADKGDIFAGEVRKAKLPHGFEKRVEERGLVVRDWAPQLEILGHPSTGGFLSHCGWNSCLESISMGVPVAAWPLHSDQPGNSVLIAMVLKIGLQVKPWSRDDELVMSFTVERAVRTLMASREGYQMRKRAAELGDAVGISVMEGGAARKQMDWFIAHITRSIPCQKSSIHALI